MACRRHLRDLKEGAKRGLTWNASLAVFYIEFFRLLRHSKGEWARRPFELQPWQKFVVGSVFGWIRKDGTRRFRTVYEELPRKQGKSTKLAGIGLIGLVADDEPGAEIYTAATRRDQARIIFDEAKRMVTASPELRKKLGIFKLNLSIDATASKFEPLSSDERTLDGLNPHIVLIDELHKHKSRALLDVLDTALGSRRQPLLWVITTAGDDDPESVYATENAYAVNVLEGVVEDDSAFVFITTIDTKPHDEVLRDVTALKQLDETCNCGNVPHTLIEKLTSEACANHAIDAGGKKTRRAAAPIIPTDPTTQRGYARPATTGLLSMPTRLEESGLTPPRSSGPEITRTDVGKLTPDTERSQTQNEKASSPGAGQTTEFPKPNTTSDTPSSRDAAGSAARKPDLYAWITSTVCKGFGDFSAENAIRESVFLEILRNIYFAHSPTCAAHEARLARGGLVITVPADRWDDPKAWAKANPNLGVSVKLDDLKRQAAKAKKSPSAQAAFKRLRLNVRTASASQAIDLDVWRKNSGGRFDPATMRGRRCYGGLDLSSKVDISAWVKLFPPIGEETRSRVVARFWMPADTVADKSDRDKVQYQRWIDDGWIEPTGGNVIDHNEIQAAILEDHRTHELLALAYDPWNATQLAVGLQNDGVEVFEFIQGIRSYTAPTKELGALLLAGKLDHGDNPVLAWMASNLMVTMRGDNKEVMPSKKHSRGRIDGMSGLIMAIGRSLLDNEPTPYSDGRGLLVI